MNGLIIGLIAGAIALGIIVYLMPQTICPDCKTPLPKVVLGKRGKPSLTFQGWVCPKCGCEIDRMGNKISQSHKPQQP
jgi:hypothetical protein